MSITRRLFLRNTAVLPLGAATLPTITAQAEPARPALEPLVYAEDRVDMCAKGHPRLSTRERAVWHMRQLERLVRMDGGQEVVVQAIGKYTSNEDCRMIGIHFSGRLMCDDNMFSPKGGAK